MTFSKECAGYIDAHSCASNEERDVLGLIRKTLPISSSAIDWSRIVNKKEVSGVDRAHLSAELTSIANSVGAVVDDIFYVINIDDAFPALKTSLSEWLKFVDELDFVDTVFLLESKKVIIHWDFYKNLYATTV